MKRVIAVLLTAVMMAGVLSGSASAAAERVPRDNTVVDPSKIIASTDNPGGMNSRRAREAAASTASRMKISSRQFAALVEEFQKFWYVKDSDHLQDRFEEFLKTKNVDPDQLEDYDEFMEAWSDNYDEDLDFYDLEDIALGLDEPDEADLSDDEYDIDEILDEEDIDTLIDDYLDDYIDEEYYPDYGEYFDEVYY